MTITATIVNALRTSLPHVHASEIAYEASEDHCWATFWDRNLSARVEFDFPLGSNIAQVGRAAVQGRAIARAE